MLYKTTYKKYKYLNMPKASKASKPSKISQPIDFSKFRPCRPLDKPEPKPLVYVLPTFPDCSICMDSLIYQRKCKQCKQAWCRDCDKNIAICPYCRTDIIGRHEQAQNQKRE